MNRRISFLYFLSLVYLNSAHYNILTSKCVQPNFQAYNELQEFVEEKPYYDCSHGKPPLTKIVKTHVSYYLIVDPDAVPFYIVDKINNGSEPLNCFYSFVHRMGGSTTPDEGFFLTQRYSFNSSLDITHEYEYQHNQAIYVDCYAQYLLVYKNVHQPVIIGRDIRRKVELARNKLLNDSNKTFASLNDSYMTNETLTSTMDASLNMLDPNEIPESKANEPNPPKRSINVLMIVIDSVSLANFDRTMPNTSKYIRNNGFVPLDGYNKIDFNTYPNFMAMISGFNASTSDKRCDPTKLDQLDKCPLIWYDYRNAGYVTAYAEDHTRISTFNYQKVGFTRPPTDYYFKSYLEAAEGMLQREVVDGMPFCAGIQSAGERVLDLARDFAVTFQDTPHFGVFWMNTFSHDDWNAPRRMDQVFTNFFQDLKIKGVLDNDVVMFLSDHGYRFHNLMMTTQNYYEERTPFNFISLPPWMRNAFPAQYRHLLANRRKLTSNYDVFMTLQHFLHLQTPNFKIQKADSCPNCKSLLEPIEDRSCYEAGIPDSFCTCTGDLFNIPVDHPLVNMTLWRMASHLQNRLSIVKAKKSEIVNNRMYVIVFFEDVWMRTGYIATSLVKYKTIPPKMELLRLQSVFI